MLLPLSTPKLSIGCPILDDCLGGGIPCNSITELTGESDYGRTQLCLQLTVGDIEAFIAIDHTRLPVKLIVIDSIAALFRSQYQTTPTDLKRRSEMFFNISGTLKGLANKFGLVVVVTTQVVDFIGPHDGVNGVRLGNLESLDISGRWVSPALGLAWAHCINSRVFLARHKPSIGVNIRNAPSTTICSQTHRTFHLVFAPHLADASAEFVIRKEGPFIGTFLTLNLRINPSDCLLEVAYFASVGVLAIPI
ncbi:hypothetical protein L3X38_008780 [Prunus dulcis]|uniref:RecA family profile 1 domain-containing protein n=1 Tax=Prunus dulcis TaxID=3755 RepID=A0AAD4ZX29_PRUDU|nr:hypothetical protein L3X38_008780 [Prunus dulcis]